MTFQNIFDLNFEFPSKTADLLDFPSHCLYKHKGKSSKSVVLEGNSKFKSKYFEKSSKIKNFLKVQNFSILIFAADHVSAT